MFGLSFRPKQVVLSSHDFFFFFEGHLRGLLGNFNGDDNDDFVSRQNVMLPSDASMKDLHYNFGMTCEFGTKESVVI
jgi:hypothetical protein